MDAKGLVNTLISLYCDKYTSLNEAQLAVWGEILTEATALAYGEDLDAAKIRVGDYTEDSRCAVCDQPAVNQFVTHWSGPSGFAPVGFTCVNDACEKAIESLRDAGGYLNI